MPDSWRRAEQAARGPPTWAEAGASAATVGPWLVLVLLACGLIELMLRRITRRPRLARALASAAPRRRRCERGLLALAWVALKVGALSYGGGFVIVPLMRSTPSSNTWMTDGEFLAVALGR